MSTQIQRRRGTTTEHDTFTGAEGEITVDTTKDTAVVHDGVTAGGAPLARENLSNVAASDVADKVDGQTVNNLSLTGTTTLAGATTTANINFGDDDKAIFGAGSDLQIWHNGDNSYIQDLGTGNLVVQADEFLVQNTAGTANYIRCQSSDESVQLRYSGDTKINTNSAGVNVTGQTATDTLSVSGTSLFSDDVTFYNPAGTELGMYWDSDKSALRFGRDGKSYQMASYESIVLPQNDPETWIKIALVGEGIHTFRVSMNGFGGYHGLEFTLSLGFNSGGSAGGDHSAARLHDYSISTGFTETTKVYAEWVDSSQAYIWINAFPATGGSTTWYADVSGISNGGAGEMIFTATTTDPSLTPLVPALNIDIASSLNRVGINNDSPTTALDVTGTIKTDDLIVDTTTLVTDSANNRVGINTNAPTASLHVEGIARIDNSPADGAKATQLELGKTSSDTVAWQVKTQDDSGDRIEFKSLRYGANFDITRNSSTGEVKVADFGAGENNATVLNLYGDEDDNTVKIKLDAGGDSYFSGGNVGIGTSSPKEPLHVNGPIVATVVPYTSNQDEAYMIAGTTSYTGATTNTGTYGIQHRFKFDGSGNSRVTIDNNAGEMFAFTASGNFLVGKSTTGNNFAGVIVAKDGTSGGRIRFTRADNTNTQYPVIFYTEAGSTVGSITNTTTSTAYNTSSDYRLKEDWQPMVSNFDRVSALNPVNFAWKATGERVDGFLAHELAEVIPDAVTGEKDAMRTEEYELEPAVFEDVVIPAVTEERLVTEAVLDDEGNELEPAVYETVEIEAERTESQMVSEAVMGTREVPEYQAIDQSKIVPLLAAALQDAIAKIETLEAKVAALESE